MALSYGWTSLKNATVGVYTEGKELYLRVEMEVGDNQYFNVRAGREGLKRLHAHLGQALKDIENAECMRGGRSSHAT